MMQNFKTRDDTKWSIKRKKQTSLRQNATGVNKYLNILQTNQFLMTDKRLIQPVCKFKKHSRNIFRYPPMLICNT